MTWLDWKPTAREELAELDRRDLHESIAADRRERADRHADQHPSSSTSAARRPPSPDGVASCSETFRLSADDVADWQHVQALTSDGVCATCEGGGEIVWNPSWRGDPQMEQSARCPDCHEALDA